MDKMRICYAALVPVAIASCDRARDVRPGNLVGDVTCKIVDTASTSTLTVRITLDSIAATEPARMELLPIRAERPEPGELPNRLVAGFGAANGAIHECGGVRASVINFDVSGEMASYPTWARAYSYAPVTWVIVDADGHALADTLELSPGGADVQVRWRDVVAGKRGP